MRSVGSRLREAREKKGYSLQDINSRTRINSKNLAAIETDEVSNISSPFFYRSFVRQYAQEVDLDFQVLSAGVELLAGNMRQPDLPGQGEHQIVRVAPLQARAKRDWGWVLPTAVLVGVVALGSAGYTYRFYLPSLLQNPVISGVLSKFSSNPANANKAAPVSVARKLTPPPSTPVTQDGPPATADRIHLELAATERTWLSVSADGKTAYTGILEPAETKVLEGQENAKLRTGNAGGVSIIFNGKSIGSIGPRGTTRTVVFSKTGYEIEAPGSTALLSSNHIGG